MSAGSAAGATAVGLRTPPHSPTPHPLSSPAPAAAAAAAAGASPTRIQISGGGALTASPHHTSHRYAAAAGGAGGSDAAHTDLVPSKPDSSCNKTMFKIVAWIGFFTAVFGVFLFLGSYYCPPGSVGLAEATSMGALTPTFEAIGKMTAVWAFKLGTDAILLSSTIMTIGGVLMLTGIFGGILDNIRREQKRALEHAKAEADVRHQGIVAHQNAQDAAEAAAAAAAAAPPRAHDNPRHQGDGDEFIGQYSEAALKAGLDEAQARERLQLPQDGASSVGAPIGPIGPAVVAQPALSRTFAAAAAAAAAAATAPSSPSGQAPAPEPIAPHAAEAASPAFAPTAVASPAPRPAAAAAGQASAPAAEPQAPAAPPLKTADVAGAEE